MIRIEVRLPYDRKINQKVWRKFEAAAHLPVGWTARRKRGYPSIVVFDCNAHWSVFPRLVQALQSTPIDWVERLETLLMMISEEDST
jgi:hypothetical protein